MESTNTKVVAESQSTGEPRVAQSAIHYNPLFQKRTQLSPGGSPSGYGYQYFGPLPGSSPPDAGTSYGQWTDEASAIGVIAPITSEGNRLLSPVTGQEMVFEGNASEEALQCILGCDANAMSLLPASGGGVPCFTSAPIYADDLDCSTIYNPFTGDDLSEAYRAMRNKPTTSRTATSSKPAQTAPQSARAEAKPTAQDKIDLTPPEGKGPQPEGTSEVNTKPPEGKGPQPDEALEAGKPEGSVGDLRTKTDSGGSDADHDPAGGDELIEASVSDQQLLAAVQQLMGRNHIQASEGHDPTQPPPEQETPMVESSAGPEDIGVPLGDMTVAQKLALARKMFATADALEKAGGVEKLSKAQQVQAKRIMIQAAEVLEDMPDDEEVVQASEGVDPDDQELQQQIAELEQQMDEQDAMSSSQSTASRRQARAADQQGGPPPQVMEKIEDKKQAQSAEQPQQGQPQVPPQQGQLPPAPPVQSAGQPVLPQVPVPAQQPQQGQPLPDAQSAEQLLDMPVEGSVQYEVLTSLDEVQKEGVTAEMINMSLYAEGSVNPYWNVEAAGEPIGRISLQDQERPEEARSWFCSAEFVKGVRHGVVRHGLRKTLAGLSLRPWALRIEKSQLAQQMKAKTEEAVKKIVAVKMADLRDRYIECQTMAAAMLNKNMAPKLGNPLKESFYVKLKGRNVDRPLPLVEACFVDGGLGYYQALAAQTEELINMPKEAYESLKQAVAGSSVIEQEEITANSNGDTALADTMEAAFIRGNMPVTTVQASTAPNGQRGTFSDMKDAVRARMSLTYPSGPRGK